MVHTHAADNRFQGTKNKDCHRIKRIISSHESKINPAETNGMSVCAHTANTLGNPGLAAG